MSLLNQKMATRREQILETARGLIESKGYEGLTMRNLAAKSGVTVPTIYNLIGNKEEVLFATVEERHAGPLRLYVPELASVDWLALLLSALAVVLVFGLRAGIALTLGVCAALSLIWLQLIAG